MKRNIEIKKEMDENEYVYQIIDVLSRYFPDEYKHNRLWEIFCAEYDYHTDDNDDLGKLFDDVFTTYKSNYKA